MVKSNAPSVLLAVTVSSSAIDLVKSNNADNDTAVSVYQSCDGANFSLNQMHAANSNSYRGNGLAVSTQYYFRVTAQNSADESVASKINVLDNHWLQKNFNCGEFSFNQYNLLSMLSMLSIAE